MRLGKYGKMHDFIADNVFQNKTVLVTGHTGFIGSWLTTWLIYLNAKIVGLAQKPPTEPSLYESNLLADHIINYEEDVRNFSKVQEIIENHKPEFIFHLAAQPLVRRSYKEPMNTFSTNIIGTMNILEAIRNTNISTIFINFTSDKCYENRETTDAYKENDKLGGHDPYSASKACSEILTNSFRQSFFENTRNTVRISTIRAGNVIGGGDWAEDRLIPDCIKHFEKKEKILIRNPKAIRPWQHVFEPILGMLALAENMEKHSKGFNESWNIGPNHTDITVAEVVEKIIKKLGTGKWEQFPDKNTSVHEAGILKLDSTKIKEKLNWKQILSLDEAIEFTIDWYNEFIKKNENMFEFSINQIQNYLTKAGLSKTDETKEDNITNF